MWHVLYKPIRFCVIIKVKVITSYRSIDNIRDNTNNFIVRFTGRSYGQVNSVYQLVDPCFNDDK